MDEIVRLRRLAVTLRRQRPRIVLLLSLLALLLSAVAAPRAMAQGSVPDAPTAVAVYSIRTTELEVRWSTSDTSSTSFKIQWKSGSEEFDSSRQLTSDPATSIVREQSTSAGDRYVDTLAGLTDGTVYTVRVIATNANGDSDPSAETTGTPATTPGQPRAFIENEVVKIFESSYPWLRETWDYITTQNFPVTFHPSAGSGVGTLCSPNRAMESNLRKCYATSILIGRGSPNLIRTITHELGQVYTLANSVATTPGPLGIAHLYFYALNFGGGLEGSLCDPIELYADVLMILTHGGRARIQSTYWAQCSGTTDIVTEEALALVRSAISGQMPSWFAETYNDSNSNPDLERVRANVKTIANSKRRAVIVFQLQDAFGGYCENQKATESSFANGVTRNPWSDGGCVPEAPANVAATAVGGGNLAVSWGEPPDDGGSPIEAYKVEWKSGTQEYASSRQATVTNLADLRPTISGLTNDQSYTLQVMAYNDNGDGAPSEVTATPTATDTTAPALNSAQVDADTLGLIWNEALDESSEPATTAFTVNVGGNARGTDRVAVSGNVVTLSLASAVNAGETVTVGYSVPTGSTAKPLKDSAGNNVASVSTQMVRNDTTQVAIRSDPGLDMTYIWAHGFGAEDSIEVTVTFSENVLVSGVPELTLLIGGETRQAAYSRGSGAASLVFRYTLTEAETETVGIRVPDGAVQTASGMVRYASTKLVAPANVVLGPQTGHLVDAVRPVMLSAAGTANRNVLTVAWDKALDENSVPIPRGVGFSVRDTSGSTIREISTISVLGTVATLTLSSAVSATDQLTVSYGVPFRTHNPLKDTLGNYAGTNSAVVSIAQRTNNEPEFAPSEDGARSVDENTPANRNIGAPIQATDADNDRLTYSISGADAAFFDVVASSGQLKSKAALNHESRVSYTFTMSVTDSRDVNNNTDTTIDDTISVTVTVNDVDEPADISFVTASGVTANGLALTADENHNGALATYSASDPENKPGLTYTWSPGGTDRYSFTFTEAGVLAFVNVSDYERPTDSDRNNVYRTGADTRDSDNKLAFILFTVTVRPANEPPTITGNRNPSLQEEGRRLVGTYAATDQDDATIAWLPLEGNDREKFEFNSSNGRLEFKAPPDYENAADSGGNNVYNVTLSASGGGQTTRLGVVVTVTNMEETGSLGFSSPQPQAEADCTATLSDPDAVVSTSWTWERSTSRNGPWTSVSGASGGGKTSVYRPDADDVGFYLRVTASYTDGHGPDKSLVERSANSVIAAPVTNNPPTFATSSTTREIAEDALSDAIVGAPVTATDPGDVLTYTLSGSSLFTIDSARGRIRVATGALLDHETGPSHTVTVTASDPSTASASISVTIGVTNVNEPPEAPDGSATTNEDMLVILDVLADASDPENDDLTVRLGTGPRKGSATVDPNTYEITYTPRADYHGSDTLTYILTDTGRLTDTGAIALMVRAVHDPPLFSAGPLKRSVARTAQAGDDVGSRVSATDVDGDMLTYRLLGPDASSFEINEDAGQITVGSGVVFYPALQSAYTVAVEARDRDSAAEVEVTITVVERVQPRTTAGGGGGGGGGGPPPVPIPSDADLDWNVTRDIESLHSDNDLPTCIWSDGHTLWVLQNAASGADSVFADELENGERLTDREFELDRRNRFSHGIWLDDEILWVADSGQDLLFAYNLESGERDEAREIELDKRNRDPRGIWSDGEMIYVLDSVKDARFVYDLDSGELLSEHPLDKLNRSPRGIWSDGVTIWVSDDGAKRLFAYQLDGATLKRTEDLEFGFRPLLKTGNGAARGIWSDGDVMYVVDEQDDQIYTYNIPDAIIAQLASLSLSDLEIGEFSAGRRTYTAMAATSATVTTVEAIATQEAATVVIAPTDADGDAENGHQVALGAETEITITVTAGDGSRTKSYRIRVEKPPCLTDLTAERLSEVAFVGGSLDELLACARSLDLDALYHYSDGWVAFFLEAPEFLNQDFRDRFAEGMPAGEPLIANREPAPVTTSSATGQH